jgi:hypothetical protein
MTESFFYNDPLVLFKDPSKILITSEMTYNEKLNVIVRIVLLLSVVGFLFTSSIKYILIGLITITLITILYQYRNKNTENMSSMKKLNKAIVGKMINNQPLEIPQEKNIQLNDKSFDTLLKKEYYPVTSQNPLGNVLLTDYEDNPSKKPAQPSFNQKVSSDITKNIKKAVQKMNPDITNTTKQLYGNLWDEYELDQSNRAFFSNANTKITNDQGAFIKFLYGDLPSGKDGSKTELFANSSRYLLM